MNIRSDYIQRILQQIAKMLAALAGARARKDHEEADTLVRTGCKQTLGIDYNTCIQFDAGSVCQLLGDPQKLALLIQWVKEDAMNLRLRGDLATADQRDVFVAALEDEARRLWGEVPSAAWSRPEEK